MAKNDLEKVLALFAGISAGDADLAIKYIDQERFVQHNPYAADGVDGLTQFISQSPRDQLQLTVIRAMARTLSRRQRDSGPDETSSSTFSASRITLL